ncbi:stage II sporulation protein AB (anti-sigma F factor) [Lachnotalea glycerini]|jgi:stage II sporulation protein AB (anti-sigma F factor)|uniref:Anti-sigma F factor n=1 Tax=Lachnotalea glycerini TaxID=1763509 RepID=A0A255I9H3_9FIRM|nr:anti-sigma F factor [Lachnotalea glycerini]PXV85980.1 stage II sporulation protein AB (anti-sigma F factor) [Lachnotalea glycerini]RDY31413.1 anti-sigma F factor [Lachnotalea glycerini]
MKSTNKMKIEFDSNTNNIGFARVSVAAFLTQLNPTLEEVADVKTAVSEAVTNAVIHGYDKLAGYIELTSVLEEDTITITIVDKGKGIEDVNKAMEPLFTTKSENEHSGMGFMFMQAFMDEVDVKSLVGEGTTVIMKKRIGCERI